MASDLHSTPLETLVLRPAMGQGGADRVTLTLLKGLDRERFRLSLALLKGAGELLPEVPEDVRLLTLGAGSLWTAWLPLARAVRHQPPDLLFSTSSGANLIACLARLLASSPFRLVLSERTTLQRSDQPAKRAVLRLAKRRLYPLADLVTAVSDGVRRDLVSRLALPPDKVRVVYNPLVTPELLALARDEVPEYAAGDEPMILGAGRLVPEKGFSTLIKAFAQVRAKRNARLIILGDGPLRPRLTALADRHGIQNSVNFAGFVKNPFCFMARCEVFVLPSLNEGLPGALIQAMALGAAVVSTDCHWGPAEIIDHEHNGYLVRVDDPEAMAKRILLLLDNEALREEIGEAARRSVERYSLRAGVAAYTDALLSTVSPPGIASRG